MALRDDGIRVSIEVFKNDGGRQLVNSKSKRRILQTIQASVAKECKKYRLYVNYMIPHKNVINEGVYQNKKDLMFAYYAFTNNSEIKFAKNYWR